MSNKEFDVYYKNILRFIEMNKKSFIDVYDEDEVEQYIEDIKQRIAQDDPEADSLKKINKCFEEKFELYYESNPKPNFIGYVD